VEEKTKTAQKDEKAMHIYISFWLSNEPNDSGCCVSRYGRPSNAPQVTEHSNPYLVLKGRQSRDEACIQDSQPTKVVIDVINVAFSSNLIY